MQSHSKMYQNYTGPQPKTYLAFIKGSYIVLQLHFASWSCDSQVSLSKNKKHGRHFSHWKM